jgi:hypothetical protein
MYTASKNVYRDRIEFASPGAVRTFFVLRRGFAPAELISTTTSARGRSMSDVTSRLSEGF